MIMNNPYGTAICPVCGKEFIKKKYNNTLCSAECKKIYENKRRVEMRKNRMPIVKCVICGKEFKQNHGAQKCCSPECAKKNHDLHNNVLRKAKKQSNNSSIDTVETNVSRNKTNTVNKKVNKDKFQEVIDAQRGPVEELYAKSRKWTKEQREFAKERYRKIYLGKF